MDSLRIVVIWSPEDPLGLPLAEIIARHFDNAEETRAFGGIRIPVFVRYEPFSADSTAPRVVDLDAAEHNLIVVVGTHHLIDRLNDDLAWAAWFADIRTAVAARGRKDRISVVSLESNALQLPGLPGLHAVRAYQWNYAPQSAGFRNHLLLLLTNRCGSLLQDQSNSGTPTAPKRVPKQRLFISHAKLDGANDAIRIRQRLDETDFGIEPFVDVNDLTGGEIFTDELEAEIADSTLLALYTDAYGSRPFCRWEVLRAKFHRRPMYIVHRLKEGENRVFPYGGNAPLIVVNDLNDDTIDRILLAAMTIVLRGLVWRRLAEAVIARKGLSLTEVITLARTPELVDFAHIKMQNTSPSPRMIVYPDPALSDEERELIPALNLGIEAISLSELEARS